MGILRAEESQFTPQVIAATLYPSLGIAFSRLECGDGSIPEVLSDSLHEEERPEEWAEYTIGTGTG